MKIVMVLRSGGQYTPLHARALTKQLTRFAPGVGVLCLTDEEVQGVECVPLAHGWPGWWAKMELFRPDLEDDFLYLDLDTVVLGEMREVLAVEELTMLRDFYHPERLGSGMMRLPKARRTHVWNRFILNPQAYMAKHLHHGDQQFLQETWANSDPVKLWQDAVPGHVVSWKVDCLRGIVPPGARIVCMHGLPKPWHVAKFHPLYLEGD